MIERKILRFITLVAVALCVACVPAFVSGSSAQERKMDCNGNDHWWGDNYSGHCEIREQTISAGGTLSVNGGRNGGISIKGWDRNNVLVRARIQTGAKTSQEAAELARQIRIETGGSQVRAEGPTGVEDQRWAVSYEIYVPQQSDLSLETYNGGISVADVRGQIEFKAHNGGVSLRRLGGNVRGATTNGGLNVDLAGNRWEGEGLDAVTTNGGVNILIPENYSARLESGTRNGGLNLGFPVTVQGRVNKEISVDLGSGGATVRAVTTNGGVTIKRKGQD
ncbi:MAG TPA: DUF4097 family beta strand repeat-containing protein [Blastocatellia bacterium]|nr:DUF4097 family beta strand repeat-containing protein [Blastocatellia bacterium]